MLQVYHDNPNFRIDTTSFGLLPEAQLLVEVTFSPATAANHDVELWILSNDPDQDTLKVTLLANGVNPPLIDVHPDSLSTTLNAGETEVQIITIDNSAGGNDLEWSIDLSNNPQGMRVNTTTEIMSSSTLDVGAFYKTGVFAKDYIKKKTILEVKAAGTSEPAKLFGVDLSNELILQLNPSNGAMLSTFPLPASISGPEGLAYSNGFLYLSTNGSGLIYKMDGSTGEIVDTSNFPLVGVDGLAHSGEHLYLQDYNTAAIYKADFDNETILDTISIGQSLYGGITFGGSRNSIFATNFGRIIYEIDIESNQIINSFTYRDTVYGLGYSNELGVLFVADVSNAAIMALNPDDGSVLYQVTSGVFSAICGDEAFGDFVTSWLSTNATTGTVPAGMIAEVEVSFDASNLNAGFYESTIIISSNDFTNPLIELPVNMEVIGEPSISSDVDSLDFSSVVVGDSIVRTVMITNDGSDNLDVSNVMASNLDFEIDTLSFSLIPDQSISLNILYHPQNVEVDDAELWILSNDADTDTLKISLQARALAPSEIDLNVESLTTTLYSDETGSASLQILNKGGSDLDGQIFLAFQSGSTVRVSPIKGNGAHYELEEVQKLQKLQKIRDTQNLLAKTNITSQNAIFSDDIENGYNGWSTAVYSGQDIWHQTQMVTNGGAFSWWCGIESLFSYNTGSRVNTAVISPVISLPNNSGNLTLIFDEAYETEGGWDFCMVDISSDGGTTWVPLRGTATASTAVSGSSDGWITTSLDITSFAEEDIQVRFYFDTGDGESQDFFGWLFDNVSIVSDKRHSGPLSLSNSLMFLLATLWQ